MHGAQPGTARWPACGGVDAPHGPRRSRHSGSPALVRFLLTTDGCGYAHFADKVVLVLSPSAAAFQLVSPDGSLTRQLTACATSVLRLRVTAALHARNAVSPAAPLLLLSLLPPPAPDWPAPFAPGLHTGRHYFTYAAADALCWPSDASSAAHGHAVSHADGSLRILSLDRLGWLLLSPDGTAFQVCFPAQIAPEVLDDETDFPPSDLPTASPPEFDEPHVAPQLPPSDPSSAASAVSSAGARVVLDPWGASPEGSHGGAALLPSLRQKSLFFTRGHSALADLPSSWRHPLQLALSLRGGFHRRQTPTPSGIASPGEPPLNQSINHKSSQSHTRARRS